MSCSSLVIISQDHVLLSELDEPLQRSDYQTQLFSHLRSWQSQKDFIPCTLLVLDLDTLENALSQDQLHDLTHRSRHVLIIPGRRQAHMLNIPTHWSSSLSRSGGELLTRIRVLFGDPGRLFVRTPFNCDVTIRPQEQEAINARSCDLSAGGVFLESLQPLSSGEMVVMHFDGVCFSCDGYVAWQRTIRHGRQPLHGAGVQFLFPDRPKLRQLLASQLH